MSSKVLFNFTLKLYALYRIHILLIHVYSFKCIFMTLFRDIRESLLPRKQSVYNNNTAVTFGGSVHIDG